MAATGQILMAAVTARGFHEYWSDWRRYRQATAANELRDSYAPADPDWLDWHAGKRFDPAERWADWSDLVRATVPVA
jgi:hypothetical protein